MTAAAWEASTMVLPVTRDQGHGRHRAPSRWVRLRAWWTTTPGARVMAVLGGYDERGRPVGSPLRWAS